MILEHSYQNNVRSNGDWSGKLHNPGKKWFLQAAANAVRKVNLQRDKNGERWSRKAMRICGLALDANGNWTKEMLRLELQSIIERFPDHFAGRKTAEEE